MKSAVLGDDLQKLFPLIYEGQSDTACFDNALELLLMAGYPIAQAMMMMIPEAWENHTTMDDNRRAFYEYHAAMMEPWDGPAAMAFTDGRHRRHAGPQRLRPARYIVTDDDLVVMASESGVLPIPESKIVQKWRLQPGKMFLIDLEAGRIIDDKELKDTYANAKPYKAVDQRGAHQARRDQAAGRQVKQPRPAKPCRRCWTASRPSATPGKTSSSSGADGQAGEEATGSMGNDSPLAVMSNKLKPLYNYFKQLFAQVTNPPIDPIREAMVMSLVSFIGPKPNCWTPTTSTRRCAWKCAAGAGLRRHGQAAQHQRTHRRQVQVVRTGHLLPAGLGQGRRGSRLASLCAEAVDAVKSGHNILIVSDRAIGADQVAIPALLATSAIHQHLVSKGLRTSPAWWWKPARPAKPTTSPCWPATARKPSTPTWRWKPWPKWRTACRATCRRQGHLQLHQGDRQGPDEGHVQDGHFHLYVLLRRADFEAIGLNKSLVDKYFTGTASNVEGIGVFEVAEEALRLHRWPSATIPCWPTSWTPAANTPSASAAKTTCGRRTRSPSCSTPPAQQLRQLQGIRADHQRPEQAPPDPARPVRVQARSDQGHSAGRSRAGQGNRQALRHRRHVAGLDLTEAHATWPWP
jgi:glutamate synthase (NADPH/NADH) large chain